MEPQNAALRERSGSVDAADPLVDFFYHLLRDHLPAGEVEGIMQKHVFPNGDGWGKSQFCNGFIANYAKDLAQRLRHEQVPAFDHLKALIFKIARSQRDAEEMVERFRSTSWNVPEMFAHIHGVGTMVMRDVVISSDGKILSYRESTLMEDPFSRRT